MGSTGGAALSAVEKLGFEPHERVVVVHVDDMGLSPAANVGALRALEGSATCGSIMAPCPAFDEIARVARLRPELDLGVHLTLNSEWEKLRWPPVRDDVPGLVSPDGGMWRSTGETVANASPDEVERELRAQIDRALEAGIDVTHLDSHMGTVFNLKFAEVYFRLGRDYRLPIFVPRVNRETLDANRVSGRLEAYLEMIDAAEAAGFPIFDHFDSNSLGYEPGRALAHNTERVDGLGAGLSYLVTHCAEGGDEIAGFAPDWQQRDGEHKIYSDGSMQRVIDERGIRTIGMRPLRDLLRESL